MVERKLQLLNILNRYDFSALAAAEENPKIRRRFLGLDLLKQGKNFREAAEIIEVSWVSLRNWLHRYERSDLAGLNNQPRRGRHSRFKNNQIEPFREAILKLNKQFLSQGKKIRGHHIQKLLYDKFNTNYTLDSVYKLLRRLDLMIMNINKPKQTTHKINSWVNNMPLTGGQQKTKEFWC